MSTRKQWDSKQAHSFSPRQQQLTCVSIGFLFDPRFAAVAMVENPWIEQDYMTSFAEVHVREGESRADHAALVQEREQQ